jgi:hypothetical protein
MCLRNYGVIKGKPPRMQIETHARRLALRRGLRIK